MQFMPDSLDIFLIDLLGHGESDAPQIDYTISNQFQALREFMALRNNGDSYLFGHSYGAWIAAYYASQPYTCKGIILEDAAGIKETFDDIIKRNDVEKYKEMLLHGTLAINNNKDYVMKSILDLNFGQDALTAENLTAISVRAQIIWGGDDPLINKSYAQVLKDGIKNSKLEIIDGAGHDPHYTHPEIVAKIITDFIEQ